MKFSLVIKKNFKLDKQDFFRYDQRIGVYNGCMSLLKISLGLGRLILIYSGRYRELPGGTGRYREVPGGTREYRGVPGNYRETTGNYRELPGGTRTLPEE